MFFFCFACADEKIKKQDYESLVNQEMESISFKEVDIFPNFISCETGEDATATQQCFIETLHVHLTPFFEDYEIKKDSLHLHILINKKGNLLITEIYSTQSDTLSDLKSNLNSYLQKELPSIHPAQKQGIPVNCSFTLPVILTSETSNQIK